LKGLGVIVFLKRFRLLFIFRLELPTTGVDVCTPVIDENEKGGVNEVWGEEGELERGNRNLLIG